MHHLPARVQPLAAHPRSASTHPTHLKLISPPVVFSLHADGGQPSIADPRSASTPPTHLKPFSLPVVFSPHAVFSPQTTTPAPRSASTPPTAWTQTRRRRTTLDRRPPLRFDAPDTSEAVLSAHGFLPADDDPRSALRFDAPDCLDADEPRSASTTPTAWTQTTPTLLGRPRLDADDHISNAWRTHLDASISPPVYRLWSTSSIYPLSFTSVQMAAGAQTPYLLEDCQLGEDICTETVIGCEVIGDCVNEEDGEKVNKISSSSSGFIEPFIGKLFDEVEDAQAFYKAYARRNGFAMRTNHTRFCFNLS